MFVLINHFQIKDIPSPGILIQLLFHHGVHVCPDLPMHTVVTAVKTRPEKFRLLTSVWTYGFVWQLKKTMAVFKRSRC